MLQLGVVIAGLFLFLREALPLIEAHRTGIVRTRGSRQQKVERAVEPERFQGLVGQRFKALGGPVTLLFGGLAWLLIGMVW